MAIALATALNGLLQTRAYPALYPGYGTNGATGFTVMSWVYRTAFGSSDPPVLMHGAVGTTPTAGDNFFVGIRTASSTWQFIAKRWGTTQGVWDWSVMSQSRWICMVVTYDYSSTGNVPTLYYDAVPQTLNSTIATPVGTLSTSPAQTVSLRHAGNGTSARLTGAFAHQAIWRRTLSHPEVREVQQLGPLAVPRGLVGYWPLDLQRFGVWTNLAPGYEAVGKAFTHNGLFDVGTDPYQGRYLGSPNLRIPRIIRRSASKLGITTQPSGALDGTAFSTQPVIQLQDSDGTAILDAGRTITAANATGSATLGGTPTAVTNSSGAATFTNLKETGATGNHSIIFTEPTLTAITSSVFNVAAAAVTPTKLLFTTQPVSTVVGITMPSFVVSATDASGVVGVLYVSKVTVSWNTNPNSAPIPSGTTAQSCVSGVATFNDIVVNTLQTNASFNAASSNATQTMTAINSAFFSITTASTAGGDLFGGGIVHVEP